MYRRPVLVVSLVLVAMCGVAAWASLKRSGTLGAPSDLMWLMSFAAFAGVGALVLKHQPGHRVGLLFVVAGLGTPLAAMLEELGLYADAPLLRTLALMAFGVTWMVATAYLLLFYPDGDLPSRRWRPVARGQLALMGLLCLAVAVNPLPLEGGAGARSPLAVDSFGVVPERVVTACLLGSAIVTVLALGSLVQRWRRAGGQTRRRLAWLALGAVVVIVLTVLGWALHSALRELPAWVGAALETVQIFVMPAVTYAAMVRHRLFDIELILRRSLVYVLLTGVVLLSFGLMLVAASSVAGARAGVGASLVTSAVVAALLVPAKTVLDRRVERLLFGDRRRPEVALAVVGANLERVERASDVLPAAAESIRQTLRLASVSIHLSGQDVPVVCAGTGGDVAARVEMRAFGQREGELVVRVSDPGDRLRPRELVLVEQLAQQVALLARTVRLSTSLQDSRERLVAAREDERRRLRRDLHDGVGPVLAGLTLQVDALRGFLVDQEGPGAVLAATMKSELRRAIAALRQTVEGLRPDDLDQLGLAGVLAVQARTLSVAGLRDVQVECPTDLSLSAATEVAAYRIVTEAMTNAVRHAGGRCIRVSVCPNHDRLRLRIQDDGHGLSHAHKEGVGLVSMRERAEELGGTLVMEQPANGGTVILAELPLGDRR